MRNLWLISCLLMMACGGSNTHPGFLPTSDAGDASDDASDEASPEPCTWNTCERGDASPTLNTDTSGNAGCDGVGCSGGGMGGAPGPGVGEGLK